MLKIAICGLLKETVGITNFWLPGHLAPYRNGNITPEPLAYKDMKGGVMRPKAVTLIVRVWQGSDGTVKASVKPADGGETQHFPDLLALLHYLEQAQQAFENNPGESRGLR